MSQKLSESPATRLDSRRWQILAATFVILAFFLSTTLTLKDYSLTWDEGLGNLFFGERYLHYFMSFQEKYIDFKADLESLKKPFNLYASPFRFAPYEFPPLTDTLSAACMYLLAEKIPLMDPVDAFHFFKIILSSIFLWVFFYFLNREIGFKTAIFSTTFLAFTPRFWGDVHFNPKDIAETIFFALTILAYWRWKHNRKVVNAVLVGLAAGAAVATKANAVFLPLILVLGCWDLACLKRTWRENLTAWIRDIGQHAVMAVTALAFYVASWPYLYVGNNPIQGIRQYFEFILGQGDRTGPQHFQIEPLIQVVTTMPLMLLVLWIAGIILSLVSVWKEPNSLFRLLLIWLCVPIIRISLPGMVNFDGIRHFLEFLPAAMTLAGMGFASLIELILRKTRRGRILWVGVPVLLVLGNLAYCILSIHPVEYIYYNPLIGGISGARQTFGLNEVTDYWGNGYRAGMTWLNENAETNSVLITPVADWLVDLTAPIWLRQDMTTHNELETVSQVSALEQSVYVMILNRPSYFDEIAEYCLENCELVYEQSIDGQSLLWIYQFTPGQK